MQAKYHVVKVGDVEPELKDGTNGAVRDTKESWRFNKCNKDKCVRMEECKALAYYENAVVHHYSEKPFFESFQRAYNEHSDVVLSPDDVWTVICLQFSDYVFFNAERMRSLIVSHEGKKELTVTTHEDLTEDKWEEFFEKILIAIKENTKAGIVDLLECSFSTTSLVEKMISTAVVMDTFKSYFSYGRCIPCCGIRNVLFAGDLTDWTKLLEKLRDLKQFAVTEGWNEYVDNLVPVIEQFVETYQGNVHSDFWDKIMNKTYGRLGSGSVEFISGWILGFYYGKLGRTEVRGTDIRDPSVDVPILLDNRCTGERKVVNLVGGFGGVSEVTGEGYHGYKPQMSFIIYHDGKLLPHE
jgi:hypothetical protein